VSAAVYTGGRPHYLMSMSEKIERSDEEWRKLLSSEEYQVLRRKGTERAFTGRYWQTKEPGTYVCAACGNALFSSETKYESGSGWPSFYAPLEDEAVATETDHSHGMVRTEAMCARCGSHLGHVFEDGPAPTGLRFCMNSASLKLEPEKG
jgi:peptide-methionine (R)-S-oxide reductase